MKFLKILSICAENNIMKKHFKKLVTLGLGLLLSACSLNANIQTADPLSDNSKVDPDSSSPSTPTTPSETPAAPSTPSIPTYVCAGGPTVFSTNMNARYVIGQNDFVSNSANQGGSASASTLNNPVGITVANGKLYVADAGNNRILVYNNLPTSNGVAADAVIGQADFLTTTAGTSASKLNGIQSLSSDGTYLAVAEWSNSRVSLWPLANPSTASYVLGQPDMNSSTVNNGGISNKSMGAAAGVGFANGKLYVGDATNSRVLVFNSNSLTNFANALNVIGQSNFTNSAGGSGLSGFAGNYSLTTNGTKLAILDNNNDRVLFYNSLPTSDGVSADFDWGGWGVANNRLNSPVGISMGSDKFFIADRNNDRVLVFNSIPTASTTLPDAVLGQSVYTSSDHNQCNCSTAAANTLWGVHHIYWDGCRLYVTDKQNNRVLVY